MPVEEPYRVNHRIRVPEVRLLIEDEDGEEKNLGVMPTVQALQMAQEQDLDLVEIAPQAQPPVCKIMDYGRFKYTMERKAREAHRQGRAGRAASEMKDVQLSPRIDDHDRLTKVERARGFLLEGHPVRMVVRFLGRDMRHPEVGMQALQEALAELGERVPITVVQQPRMEGRQLFTLVHLAKGAKVADKGGNGAKGQRTEGNNAQAPAATEVSAPPAVEPVAPAASLGDQASPAASNGAPPAAETTAPEPVRAAS
ncbi:MAG TPA: translation initiation factor IF-3 [Chloroflexota bacterium]|nr:translation initiation factor IF-3 [Chloroflexota bacterium]